MPVIFASWVHAVPWEKTRPCKGHYSSQFRAMSLVIRVMDVGRCFFHKQGEKPEELDLYSIRSSIRFVGINNSITS